MVGGFGEKWRLILRLGSIATIGVSRKYIIFICDIYLRSRHNIPNIRKNFSQARININVQTLKHTRYRIRNNFSQTRDQYNCLSY